MEANDVLNIFERLCLDDLALSPDEAILELTRWLAARWSELDDEDIAILTSIGATLFQHGLQIRDHRS